MAILTPTFPGVSWTMKTPEETGVDSTKLNKFVTALGTNWTGNPFYGVIVKDGYMIKTWGDPTYKFDWKSAAKPVTAAVMMMFALYENKISSLNELTRSYVNALTGLDYIPKDYTMTWRHLINMTSGYTLPEAPGASWNYNDYGVNLYSKLLFDVIFKQTANIATTTRLASLQFQDGSIYSTRQGYGVYTTPRDFARIGLLLLNKYNWKGTQLLPSSYFDNYVKVLVDNNLQKSIGANIINPADDYLNIGSYGGGANQSGVSNGPGIYGTAIWWNGLIANTNVRNYANAPLDTFEFRGANGRAMIIIPSLGLIVSAVGNWGSDTYHNTILQLLLDSIIVQPPQQTFTRTIKIEGNGTVKVTKNGILVGTASSTNPITITAELGESYSRTISSGTIVDLCLNNVCGNTDYNGGGTFNLTHVLTQEFRYIFTQTQLTFTRTINISQGEGIVSVYRNNIFIINVSKTTSYTFVANIGENVRYIGNPSNNYIFEKVCSASGDCKFNADITETFIETSLSSDVKSFYFIVPPCLPSQCNFTITQ